MTRETYDKAVALQTEISEIKQLINDCKDGQARIEVSTPSMRSHIRKLDDFKNITIGSMVDFFEEELEKLEAQFEQL